ncbi:MAG: hypothetical protein ACK4PR_06875 [Gammaproteobacteria bacterium]
MKRFFNNPEKKENPTLQVPQLTPEAEEEPITPPNNSNNSTQELGSEESANVLKQAKTEIRICEPPPPRPTIPGPPKETSTAHVGRIMPRLS